MHRIQPYLLPSLLAVVFIGTYYPALALFSAKWSGSEDYAHAFFIVPVIIYMIWAKRQVFTARRGSSVIGLILVILSILFYLIALRLQVPTLVFLATIASIVSALIYIGGLNILRELAIPILLMFMIIPIPNQLMSMVTASLQLKISEINEVLIRLFAIPMYREGNVLHVEGMSFQVIEACSGVRSLISMTTLSVIISYLYLKKTWSAVILFLFSIPAAIFINIIRVLGLVLAYHYFHLDLSTGLAHTLTGLILFLFGLALLVVMQRILEWWETKNNNI